MNVYDHLDYREVVRAWLAGRAGRSQSTLARRLGTSRSLIAMILKGERHIPVAQARTWADGLGLQTADEQGYWEALVRAEHGETLALRRAARTHLRAMREYLAAPRLPEDAADLIGLWYVPVLMELAGRDDFVRDPVALAAVIWPRVDAAEIAAALDRMEELGFFDGGNVATDRILDGRLAEAARAYHVAQLEHARDALESIPHDERYLASLTVAIRSSDLPALLASLHRFHIEVVDPHRAAAGDLVVQLSVQLFPRTRA